MNMQRQLRGPAPTDHVSIQPTLEPTMCLGEEGVYVRVTDRESRAHSLSPDSMGDRMGSRESYVKVPMTGLEAVPLLKGVRATGFATGRG